MPIHIPIPIAATIAITAAITAAVAIDAIAIARTSPSADEERYLDISAIRAAIIKIFNDRYAFGPPGRACSSPAGLHIQAHQPPLPCFNDSDDDGNGYLTIDEFMLQVRPYLTHI